MGIFADNNLLLLLAVLLPPMFYAAIVWWAAPRGVIKIKTSFLYFLTGLISISFVDGIHWVFPNFLNPAFDNIILSYIFLNFMQVALIEESMKFIAFKITDSYRPKKHVVHPAATIFYMMSVGCGFAVLENISYINELGGSVILARTFTALLLHMMCGILMGYLYFRFVNSERMSKLLFGFLTLTIPIFYHGLYDFVLGLESALGYGRFDIDGVENKINLTDPTAIFFVVFGLFICYKLTRKIFRRNI